MEHDERSLVAARQVSTRNSQTKIDFFFEVALSDWINSWLLNDDGRINGTLV
jgi:hypothetical protein